MKGEPMKGVLALLQGFLYLCTAAVSYAHYADLGTSVPPIIYHVLLVAIIGVSIILAVGHIIGGGLMGMTAGGVWGGMKLGFILGTGAALSRLWPYAFIIGVVAFLNRAPTWHVVVAAIFGICCLVMHLVMRFFWNAGSSNH